MKCYVRDSLANMIKRDVTESTTASDVDANVIIIIIIIIILVVVVVTCYSATYMSQTRDQQRFTISEVAADWHEPMVPQRIMSPSIARATVRSAVQLADITSPQSATLGLHPVAVATTHFRSR